MPLGTLAIRKKDSNPTHHLYRNGNLWWVHFFVHHSGFKARRVRKSLCTGSLAEAIARRDKLFEEIREKGLEIPEKTLKSERRPKAAPRRTATKHTDASGLNCLNQNNIDSRNARWAG
jgi:hypothetical protein